MPIWQDLFGNLAAVALSIFIWEWANTRFECKTKLRYNLAFGATMGLSAVASMMMAVHLPDGLILDFRSALVSIAGFFGGPVSGLVAAAIAVGYRVWFGGTGMLPGIGVIAIAAVAGIAGHLLARRHPDRMWQLALLSVAATAALLIGILSLPAPLPTTLLQKLGVPVLGLTFVATFVAGLVILQGQRIWNERRLLLSAMSQSPDFQYVKNCASQFVIVNQHVADHHGLTSVHELRGKTDFDVGPTERAKKLFDEEQRLLRTRQPIRDFIECVVDGSGQEHWYSTSKSIVVGRDGEVIGLTGVTHDITNQKNSEAELQRSQSILSHALAGMSDGLAMFDADDVLMFCNEQYRQIFALTASARVPGAHLRDILGAVVETQEQVGIPAGEEDRWIEDVIATVHNSEEREVQLRNGRWLRVRTQRSEDGMSTVTVSDISVSRQAQDALMNLTTQLKSLAGTDGLTGLFNRRSFDESLSREIEKTSRAVEPLSLLMIDVDHFKSFNDLYGHVAGDDCLKAIGQCLQKGAQRPRDIAARYGGEEFAILLPDTDQAGAKLVADSISQLLADLAIPHSGNRPEIVTVSIGASTYSSEGGRRNAVEIVQRADDALYQAKRSGRNCYIAWQPAERQLVRQ